ncbi:hypothetical protein Clacol_007891 [Clathrus columnatus]|uniref:Peptidase M20 dimerisation domain-containing protein n=1 Tax=Clathrus columnatus TaxID=1419009 RepID=A0AAV5AH03_9AGAM|nr:hypothetical protein Clacol_007891 [Clathrus columnatus]
MPPKSCDIPDLRPPYDYGHKAPARRRRREMTPNLGLMINNLHSAKMENILPDKMYPQLSKAFISRVSYYTKYLARNTYAQQHVHVGYKTIHDEPGPTQQTRMSNDIFRPEVLKTIEEEIDKYSKDLTDLSLKIHDHPEIKYEERYAHDLLTAYMESQGFEVTRHYLDLETAWKATFTHGNGGRVLGVNSEMDALPGIGHACGHNLIATVGVGISLAVRAALIKHNVSGKICLLGTPAEEGGGGKVILIERGGYKNMDVCLMAHPAAGNPRTAKLGSSQASQELSVEYQGHPAHASAAPWEGQNALDAAFIAYGSISALRQQVKPTHRIHGIVEGRDWAANVIPDYAKMTWVTRAPTAKETEALTKRVVKCLEAAALATETKATIKHSIFYYNLTQNTVLVREFTDVAAKRYGIDASSGIEGAIGASTDFLSPRYILIIPTQPNGGNHTARFTESARTKEAHDITFTITKILALVGFRVLDDELFFKEVHASFKQTMKITGDTSL